MCLCVPDTESLYIVARGNEGYMFNKEEYDTIVSICNKNEKLSCTLSDLRETSLDELSVVSHEIKNYAAYLKTSYQFISRKNSELKDNKFWNNMGATINELVEYMNRTSLYRYSFKDSETIKCSVSGILERIVKYIDKKYSDNDYNNNGYSNRDYDNKDYDEKDYDEKNYDKKQYTNSRNNSKILLKTELVNTDENTAFYISSHLLTLGINELIDNAYEAATDNVCETITSVQLGVRISNYNDRIILSVINHSNYEPDDSLLISNNANTCTYNLSKLCTPFFTTKENHTGLGLSSVYQMCILSGTEFNMTYNNASHMTTASILLKKI